MDFFSLGIRCSTSVGQAGVGHPGVDIRWNRRFGRRSPGLIPRWRHCVFRAGPCDVTVRTEKTLGGFPREVLVLDAGILGSHDGNTIHSHKNA